MAVCEMKFISIIGMMSEIDDVIRICGNSKSFEPDNVFSFYSNTEKFSRVAEENPYSDSIKILKDTITASGQTLNLVDVENFYIDNTQISEYINNLSEKLGQLTEKKKLLKNKLDKYIKEEKQLEHFFGFNEKLDEIMSCQYIKARFGRLPRESYYKLSLYENEKEVLFFPCTKDNMYYWGIYFAPIDNLDEVDRVFSSLYFENVEITYINGTAEDNVKRLKVTEEEVKKEISKTDSKIAEFWKHQKERCMRLYSKLEELSVYHEVKKYAARYNHSFILVGWIPADKEMEICQKLDSINSVECSTERGKDILKYVPPIKLKNKRFFKPFEFFVETYGLPDYNEVDPTAFVGLTYIILFGIMFADFGQGLVLSLAGYLMWKIKKMKLGRALISCGISSAFFGMIFGSVFGFENALDGFYKKVFGLNEKPVSVMASDTTNVIIYSAVGIGICLLMVAMIINIYSLIRSKKFGEAFFGQNGICGLVLYSSSVLMLLDFMLFKRGFSNGLYIALFIVVPTFFILFSEIFIKMFNGNSNWKPKSWGDYIAQSVFEMFEVILSYVTNTMSFLRVGAFVLVHAGMMMVVFTIAEMCGQVGYIITLIIGNIFVLCLEALLAGIQVLRLEFYELFSRFFSGAGKAFNPIVPKKTDV
ncbi:MAG: ATPase [Oscillospiraceae bacterium]|jgi:V/A-type H+-transporting ATPase subunit I|nr:ATPase [Oscillospiraceae bacterium]